MRRSDHGNQLRAALGKTDILPFIGVYDAFSATVAARHYDALFLSGFSFAASYYGLPDIGLIAWPDIVGLCQRTRAVLPDHHILVDIDDGYGDGESAAHVVALLQAAGASGVIMEDQRRPRRCGHADGKQLLELDQYLIKLDKVLAARKDLFVVARTDAVERDDILRRTQAFAAAGADAVLVDGISDLDLLRQLRAALSVPLMFNQIAGGKAPPYSLEELKDAGVALVNYSTPCLFAAHGAIDAALTALKAGEVRQAGAIGMKECNLLLNDNLRRRDRS